MIEGFHKTFQFKRSGYFMFCLNEGRSMMNFRMREYEYVGRKELVALLIFILKGFISSRGMDMQSNVTSII